MTKRRFGKRLSFGVAMMAVLAAPAAMSAPAGIEQEAEPAPKAAKLIKAGDVLSGELNAMKVRAGKLGKRVATYHQHR